MNNTTVAHNWANQTSDKGNGSNFYFEGKTIYSYGSHFPIATIEGNVILFTTQGYSNTTAKHKNYAFRAIPHSFKVIDCKYPLSGWNVDNLSAMEETHNEAIKKAGTARTNKQFYLQDAVREAKNCKAFCEHYDKPFPEWVNTTLNPANLESLASAAKEQAKKDAEKQAKKDAENLIKFRSFETDYINSSKSYLRKSGNEIQTSLGVKVPINEGLQLLSLIKSNAPVHGFKIGNYTVNSFDGNVLTIGCHRISMSEINHFASTL